MGVYIKVQVRRIRAIIKYHKQKSTCTFPNQSIMVKNKYLQTIKVSEMYHIKINY